MNYITQKERLEKALKLINRLKENNYEKVSKILGIGLFLYKLLSDLLNDPIKEDLKIFDKYSKEKKIAILEFLEKLIKQRLEKYQLNRERKIKPLEAFMVEIRKIPFLSLKEKKLLESLGFKTLIDVLYFFPKSYEDRRLNKSLKYCKANEKICVKVKVIDKRKLSKEDSPYNFEVLTTDGTAYLSLKYRYKDFRALLKFKKGSEWVVCGKLKIFNGERYMVHPTVYTPESELVDRIVPIYMVRKGEGKEEYVELSSATKRKLLLNVMKTIVKTYAPYFPEYIPYKLLQKYNYPTIDIALINTHLPPSTENFYDLLEKKTPYQQRLIYEEFLILSLALLLQKKHIKTGYSSPKMEGDIEGFIKEFEDKLPFQLTNAQRRVLREILSDMKEGKTPMNRLLQGDVGSGKTIVAIGATLFAYRNGYQTAVMAPTEILAQQHYKNFVKYLKLFGVKSSEIVLLTGSLTRSLKSKIKQLIKTNTAKIVIGTHALFQEDIEFPKLGLVIIDEQHRFGVLQRKALLERGIRHSSIYPHTLVMTATPIPRTLLLTEYGDLDVSIIDEMPKGRRPVITKLLYEDEKEKLLLFVRREIEKGNKVYVIYPLIEESEKLELKSAVSEWEKWKKFFPDKKVLLLHGRMKDSEKQRVMEEFKKDGHILVSTTVVEVGVDVPEATVMIIEDAHRFGLSQLHQLRGRVGRSDKQGYCFVIVPSSLKESAKEETLERLKVFVTTNDGFKIAQEDLRLRGGGNILGTQQTGHITFSIADLNNPSHQYILLQARADAEKIINKDPYLEKLPTLKKLILYRYGNKMDLGVIG